MKNAYPEGIVSSRISKHQLVEVSTSGTTGKSLSIFVDMMDIIVGLFGYLRTIKDYGLVWRRSKLTIIGDFAPHTAESGYIQRGLTPRANSQFLFKNIQWLDTNADPQDNLEQINSFQPDFIGGYVGMLGHMALLKEQGQGPKVRPKIIAATGSVLDSHLRRYIEETFDATVFEVYGATETGPIAYECPEGSYHVNSDYLYLEYFDDHGPVQPGKPGNVVVTKLFGRGTPIIRYTAMNDIVSSSERQCSCGMPGQCIKKIYGRKDLSLPLGDGRVLMPSAISSIYSRVLHQLKSTKLRDTKIIQETPQSIHLQVVINTQRSSGSSAKEIMKVLQSGFQEIVGPSISISIEQVESLKDHEARIVSNVKQHHSKPLQYL